MSAGGLLLTRQLFIYMSPALFIIMIMINHDQPPPQALRFSHGRGERETSDW